MVKVQIVPRRRPTRPKSKVTITNKTNKTVTTMMYVSRKSQTQIIYEQTSDRETESDEEEEESGGSHKKR